MLVKSYQACSCYDTFFISLNLIWLWRFCFWLPPLLTYNATYKFGSKSLVLHLVRVSQLLFTLQLILETWEDSRSNNFIYFLAKEIFFGTFHTFDLFVCLYRKKILMHSIFLIFDLVAENKSMVILLFI